MRLVDQEKIKELKRLEDAVVTMTPHQAKPLRSPAQELELCKKVTEAFQKEKDPSRRELAIQKILLKERLEPIRDDDLFAGRFGDGFFGYMPEIAGSYVGFYFMEPCLDQYLNSNTVSELERKEWEELRKFWRENATHNLAYRQAWAEIVPLQIKISAQWDDLPEHWQTAQTNSAWMWFVKESTNRVAGPYLNISLLLAKGINGLKDLIKDAYAANPDPNTYLYYESVLALLDFFSDEIIALYEKEARVKGKQLLSAALARIKKEPPTNLYEAMQLAWLYLVVARVLNTGRMDVWFGTYLINDIKEGRLTLTGAQELVDDLWKIMYEEGHNFNTRVILGGKDRGDPDACDQFALLCLEATRKAKRIRPQTTLRIYNGMNKEVREAAYNALAEGCTFPMLLNDEVNIPAVAKLFAVSEEEAAKYLPLGCGEFTLEAINICSPNSVFLLPKCLEYALHNGKDALTGLQIGPATGRVEDFHNFDDLFEAYHRQVQFFMELIVKKHSIGQQVVAEHCPFLFLSILFEDCVKKGKGLLDGVRYLDGSTETNGFVNVADSLTAIKELVYEKKKYSLKEITQALDANFEGYSELAQELLSLPKYGNDNDLADEMAIMVHCHVAKEALAWSNKLPYLRRFYALHVNNHAHVQFGAITAASADGRKAHEPLANGNNPTAGRDVSGTTAMLKSLAKIPADCVAGMVQNMKFSRQMFYKYRQKTNALLTVYFKLGGTQAMLTVVPPQDLRDALEHPERHQNLIVRVGGYSARFVELSRELQLEILKRTLNEAL